MTRAEFGTRADEFQRLLETGIPLAVRYHWAGGADNRERDTVTGALAACFGLRALEAHQVIEAPVMATTPLTKRIEYLFWLLRTLDLSLGFTYTIEKTSGTSRGGDGTICRISMRVDRSRFRGYEEA